MSSQNRRHRVCPTVFISLSLSIYLSGCKLAAIRSDPIRAVDVVVAVVDVAVAISAAVVAVLRLGLA